jgi:hypothetical protein
MGKIDQVMRGRDGVIRRVVVKYRNSTEEFGRPTDRSTRRLIKLYSADDPDLQADLGKLQARIDELRGHHEQPGQVNQSHSLSPTEATGSFTNLVTNPMLLQAVARFDDSTSDVFQLGCQCCCLHHCKVSVHNLYGSKTYCHPLTATTSFELEGMFNMEPDQPEN